MMRALNPMPSVLIRRGKDRELERTQVEGHMATKAEIGVRWPGAKTRLEPPGTGRGKGGFSLTAFLESVALPTP